MTENQKLIEEYGKTGSEPAFRELVARYINLVYATALRSVGGDAHMAEDVTQTVFIHLAQKAKNLPNEIMLGGWLHRDACYVAATNLRSQRRRQARERQSVEMNAQHDNSEADLEQIAPILDEVINKLGKQDRTAIMLRFFEQRDLRSVGVALGSNEDAARMRVNRALGKLQGLLKQRGIASSSTALGVMLATKAVVAAPSGLAASIAGTALVSAATSTGTALTILKIMAISKLKLGIAAALVVAGVATPLVMQNQTQNKLRDENRLLRQESAQLASDSQRLSNQLSEVKYSQALTKDQFNELLKLRGEVGMLKKQLTEASSKKVPAPSQQPSTVQSVDLTEEESQKLAEREKLMMRQQFIAKMGYSRNWMAAFTQYADKNQGMYPTNFDDAAPFLPDNTKEETMLATNQFEIVYRGPLKAITEPSSILVIRETQSTPSPGGSGGWNRTYGFADGHTEVHHESVDNFEAWEAKHSITHSPSGFYGQ